MVHVKIVTFSRSLLLFSFGIVFVHETWYSTAKTLTNSFHCISVCHDDLTLASVLSASSSSSAVRDALVQSKSTWCADTSDANKYIVIDLRAAKMVTGIGIQGDSNNNQWVKTFKLSHGRTNGVFTELSKVMKTMVLQ